MYHESDILDLETFSWAKDKKGKFILCSEGITKHSGKDSPTQLVGCTDYELPWRNRATAYLEEDDAVLDGQITKNYQLMDTVNGLLEVVVTKSPLLNQAGKVIGSIGSSINITNLHFQKKRCQLNAKGQLPLGKYFKYRYLTKREVVVLRYVLLGYNAKKIAAVLELSPRSIEAYINSIKEKMACGNKSEIIETAIKHGFSYLCYDK